MKVQLKVFQFMNSQSVYAENRTLFVEKNKKLRELKQANQGKEATPEMVELKKELKFLRKNMFKMDRKGIIAMNAFVNHCIKTLIDNCKPCKTTNPEKTYSWKQLCQEELKQNRCIYTLLQQSRKFRDLMTVKDIIKECDNAKDLYRVKKGLNKQECKDFMSDCQLVKNGKRDEVDELWKTEAVMIFELLDSLQKEDEDSKLLYNNIKQLKKTTDVKISDGFKHIISKIIKEVLVFITHKCDVYTKNKPNRTLKSHDVECVIRMLTSEDQTSLDYLFK